MLFNSIGYLLFLPVIVMLYYLLPFRWRWTLLLAASYFFYLLWRIEFVLVLMTATLVSYYAALKMGEIRIKKQRLKYLVITLLINVGMLAFFKYLGFFTGILNELAGISGTDLKIPYYNILVPVGISFYTFQTTGYAVDVYRGMSKPEKNLGTYALFVSFFPLVLAGPIERGRKLLPQFYVEHPFDPEMFSSGLRLILWGMFKKIVIADRLSVFVNAILSEPDNFHGLQIGIAIVMKMMMVYADFSGYTDIAIGSARLMGFRLSPNFKRPFSAPSIQAFWSRWHITLTAWLRDYVYFSLPNKLKGKPSQWLLHLNLVITFVLVGFWHGPYWGYIVFGFLNGSFMVLANLSKPFMTRFNSMSRLDKSPRLLEALNISATFMLICFSAFFFGSQTLSESVMMLRRFIDFSHTGTGILALLKFNDFILGILLVIFMLWFEYLIAVKSFANKFLAKPISIRFAAYLAMLFFILLFGMFSNQKFFYLQF
ncbi:MAG: MBOAT family O-acyltransferase [Bacteroidota bacterium]